MKACIYILPLVLTSCGRREEETAPPKIAWGKPTNGLQAGLAAGRAVRGSRPFVPLTLYARNVGGEPIRVLQLSWRRHYYLGLYEVKVDGKQVQCQLPSYATTSPPPEAYIYLAPGRVDSTSVKWRPEDWGLKPPCEVDIACIFRNESSQLRRRDPETKRLVTVAGLWTGEARSGTVRVCVARDWRKVALVVLAALAGLVAAQQIIVRAVKKARRGGSAAPKA